jgi:PPOX class probable F420-dependent enzyme
MAELPAELVALIQAGSLAHLSTINADGSPQVSVIWIGYEDGQIVSGHMNRYLKLRNIERDPRVVLSFTAPRDHGAVLNPYAVLKATATIERSDGTWDLLDRLTKIYMTPDDTFPAPKGPGYTVRYQIQRVGGVGPWKPRNVGDTEG